MSAPKRNRDRLQPLRLAATVLLLVATLAGCTQLIGRWQEMAQSDRLDIFAAASLTDAFQALGQEFEHQNPGVEVVFNFAGSQHLASQLRQGARVDLFASANQRQMQVAVESGRIDDRAPQIFACNRLVVTYPKENHAHIATLADLARPGLKLVIAAEAVPVGYYTQAFLAKAAQDPALGEAYRRALLDNVVSYEENVRAVLSKVALGEADAGIVYSSDVASAKDVAQIPIPAALNVVATYPIAPVADSLHATQAARFIDFVRSQTGQAILTQYGFLTDCPAIE